MSRVCTPPTHALAVRCLAFCCLALGAAACVSTTTGREPTEPDLSEAARLNTQLGADYLRTGKPEQALEKLQKAVQQDPDYAPARSTLALVYAARGDTVSADEQFRKAVALQPNNPQTLNNYGVFLCGAGRRDEAVGNFLRAAKSPDFQSPAAAWTNAGVCVREDHPDDAERYLREALRISPNYPEALAHLAWLSLKNKDYLRARGFLQRFEQSGGRTTAESLWVGARTEEALGDVAAARRFEQRLLTEFPASDEATELSRRNAS